VIGYGPPMRPEILFPLFSPVTTLKGVGDRVAPLLEHVAGPRVRDVVFLPPQGFIHRPRVRTADLVEGEIQTLTVTIDSHQKPARPGQPWKIRAHDEVGAISLAFFKGHGPHLELRNPEGAVRMVSGKVERDRLGTGFQIIHPDYLVPIERAAEIPLVESVYPATAGLPSRSVRRFAHLALERAPELEEWQDPAWIRRQSWPSWRAALATLHEPESEGDLSLQTPYRRRLAYDELLAHQLALGQRKRTSRQGAAPAIQASELAHAAEAALPFRLTAAQARALAEIRADLSSGQRMTRLLQGDVGSGKTVVALLAAMDAAAAGLQTVLMAPTEILSRQHFETIRGPLAARGVATALLTGRTKGAAREELLAGMRSGATAVVVGTHALFQDGVTFKALGLTIIDEQHRFGVSERGRLRAKGDSAHLLAMSATPIPRTLELTLYGDLDISNLNEKPPGRTPVATRAAPMQRLDEVVERLKRAVKDGAQAFWICPLVAESDLMDLAAAEARFAALAQVFGDRVGLIHGRLPPAEKDAVMTRFAEGRLAILVATTVVEVGVDVPAATIMVIEQAERFGLAQLHQLRGRVGRGAGASSCVLLYDTPLSDVATRRLDILRQTDDGFLIAERDLELRGGGDPLGLAQSGFPAYRLADPIAHKDLIAVAADDARLILSRDPDLSSPRGHALRVLQELFDWRADGALSASG
jgi:ATP-dependent DNA helicase RecG